MERQVPDVFNVFALGEIQEILTAPNLQNNFNVRVAVEFKKIFYKIYKIYIQISSLKLMLKFAIGEIQEILRAPCTSAHFAFPTVMSIPKSPKLPIS